MSQKSSGEYNASDRASSPSISEYWLCRQSNVPPASLKVYTPLLQRFFSPHQDGESRPLDLSYDLHSRSRSVKARGFGSPDREAVGLSGHSRVVPQIEAHSFASFSHERTHDATQDTWVLARALLVAGLFLRWTDARRFVTAEAQRDG